MELGGWEGFKGVIWGALRWGTGVTHGGKGRTETPKSTCRGQWDGLGGTPQRAPMRGAGLSPPKTQGWGRNGSPKTMVEAMAETPKNHLGGQHWGTFEGSVGGFN